MAPLRTGLVLSLLCALAPLSRADGAASEADALPPGACTVRTRQGLTVCVVTRPGAAYTAVALAVPFGRCDVPDRMSGGALLLARWMTSGTSFETEGELDQRTAAAGGAMFLQGHADRTLLLTTVAPEDTVGAVRSVLDVAFRPRLDESTFRRSRDFLLNDIKLRRQFAASDFQQKVYAALFAGHPLARPGTGTPQGVAMCTPLALRCMHALHFSPRRSFLVVVGPVRVADVAQGWSDMREASDALDAPLEPEPVQQPQQTDFTVERPAGNSGRVFCGFVVGQVPPLDERMSFALLGEILAGLDGRITRRVRGERGLTYAPELIGEWTRFGGLWGIVLQVPQGSEGTALEAVRAELRTLAELGPGEAEMEQARSSVKSLLGRLYDRPDFVAGLLAGRLLNGQPAGGYQHDSTIVGEITGPKLRDFLATRLRQGELITVRTR